MRRFFVLIPVLLVAATLVWVVTQRDGSPRETVAVPLTSDVVPFPRTTTPLPVPEMRIQSGPWADRLPAGPPSIAIPKGSGEFRRCGPIQMPTFDDELPSGTGGSFTACRTN